MHRYSAAGSSCGAGNHCGGGGSSREARGSDSSFASSAAFSLSSRRSSHPLVAYKLKCEKEPLSTRLGPPDFYPPAPNCAEEVLNRDSCVNGYKEIIDGVEESNEAKLSLTSPAYSSLWNKQNVNRYKETNKKDLVSFAYNRLTALSVVDLGELAGKVVEKLRCQAQNPLGLKAIKKRLRALNNARIRKRKAGQVYALPLTGPLLAKLGYFPEQRTCGEDFRKKWIEDLSQRKRLRSLAEHVPHGYRRRSLFEALVKHEVPLVRATWFVKIMYLNQVRPSSTGMSAGGPDKSQAKRLELWTKDVLEYAQALLDECCSVLETTISSHLNSPKSQKGGDVAQQNMEIAVSEEVQAKWRYLMRLAQWHHSEGLLHCSQLVDWALKQLQEKESVEALELLLPLILTTINGLSLSQTHVRVLVDLSIHWLQKLRTKGAGPNVPCRPQLMYCATSLTELLRYLLVVVPDTFVALDCFPLPACVCPMQQKEDIFLCIGDGELKRKDTGIMRTLPISADVLEDFSKGMDRGVENLFPQNHGKDLGPKEVSVSEVVDHIQRRAASLAKAVNPGLLRNNEGKVVQGLDKALTAGDVQGACGCVFDEDFCSSEHLPGDWQADVLDGFGRTPTLLTSVSSSELFAVRFLCEWAVCDFRDSRGAGGYRERKTVSVRDMSRVYMAVSVLRTRVGELERKRSTDLAAVKSNGHYNDKRNSQDKSRSAMDKIKNRYFDIELLGSKYSGANVQSLILDPQSTALSRSMHDLIVAWLDEHELRDGESSERLQLLLSELVRENLLLPNLYVRQLLCSGVLEKNETVKDRSRVARHKLLLRDLPEPPQLEASRSYRNERYLALHGYRKRSMKHLDDKSGLESCPHHRQPGVDGWSNNDSGRRTFLKSQHDRPTRDNRSPRQEQRLIDLKRAILTRLQLPFEDMDPAAIHELTDKNLFKRQAETLCISLENSDTPGCGECCKNKRSRTNDGKPWTGQAVLAASLEEEEAWWLRRGQKALDTIKAEPSVKPPLKHSTRGRPKTIRKTQSLAQLAAPRNEGSQGTSSSHSCDSRVKCSYHKSQPEAMNGFPSSVKSRQLQSGDARELGVCIRRLKPNERKALSIWLDSVVRRWLTSDNVEDPLRLARNSSASGHNGSLPPNSMDRGTFARWRINEEQLALIVYIMDVAGDFYTLVQLVLWMLPIAPVPPTAPPGHSSRGISTASWVKDSFDVGESILLSYLRRYEGLLAAMDLLPQALSAGMQRASNVMGVLPGGRVGCSPVLCYMRDLLRKYGGLISVQAWEKSWKVSCDHRLVAELEALRAGDSEGGFGLAGLSSSGMSDDRDDPVPQRLTGRLSRLGVNLKEIVQRVMGEAVVHMVNKEREVSAGASVKDGVVDKPDDGFLAAQRVVGGVMDTIRQNGCGVVQADSALVAGAVAFIVANAGAAVTSVVESLGPSNQGVLALPVLGPSLRCARRILQMHMFCIRLLKEAVGDRHSRMLEVSLASEASSMVLQSLQHSSGRVPRTQFHVPSEASENSGYASETGIETNILAAAAAALVAGLIVQGAITLERMISILKLRENLESLHVFKPAVANASGISRSTGGSSSKEHLAEAHVFWFRVLIGNCRMAGGGLVADLLGESNALGLARMQRSMALTVAFPPAYALFGAALRRNPSAYNFGTVREDSVLQAAINAVNEVVGHEPFRDTCLRDTRALYLLLSSDSGESEYATHLDMQGLDARSKGAAMVPLRARLFLHALLDRGLPPSLLQDEETWTRGRADVRNRLPNEPRQLEQLVQILDDLQPATYHWQWVELRLLLNEQVFMEKLDGQSALEAVQTAAAGSETGQLSECEKTFTEVVLTRLLVRPDAAALYSEAVHSLGRALEEYLILQVKWVLEGTDMLLGRKSLHQLLDSIAHRQGFSVGLRRVPSWSWQPPGRGEMGPLLGFEKKKADATSPEEGEVAEDGPEWRKKEEKQRLVLHGLDHEVYNIREFAVEKALADLVLPCLARSSNDTCSGFAFELIKQMNTLEQQISILARSVGKPVQTSTSGGDYMGGKTGGIRRGARVGLEGSSPCIGRKLMVSPDSSTLSSAALQTSMWLRLQFLLPLLPIIHTDRDQTGRNMRQTLAPILLRLLCTSVVQEATEPPHEVSTRDLEKNAEASSAAATVAAGEGLFDRLLSVLHALLSSTWAVWLKPRSSTRGAKPLREVPPFDREAAERMQTELENMQLPRSARARLQSAMPQLPITSPLNIVTSPAQISPQAITVLNPGGFIPSTSTVVLKPFVSNENSLGQSKSSSLQESEVDFDPWMLLEDGVGAGVSALVSADTGVLKACPWLKGSVRVRRSDLTYVGAVDDDP